MFLVFRPPSALGLEQPGNAMESPAPEPEKTSDAAVLDAVPPTIAAIKLSVPSSISTPANVKAGRIEAGARPPWRKTLKSGTHL
jgi:hypothetical protein